MNRTVLIVDDSPTVIKFVTVSLRNRGYNVVSASDGMDALEKMSTLDSDIDLIITDLNMPNLDGYSLIETVRQNEKYQATPIIILSSEDQDDDRDRGMAVGASSYLVKPFKPAVLVKEVEAHLDRTGEAVK